MIQVMADMYFKQLKAFIRPSHFHGIFSSSFLLKHKIFLVLVFYSDHGPTTILRLSNLLTIRIEIILVIVQSYVSVFQTVNLSISSVQACGAHYSKTKFFRTTFY